MRWTDLAGLNGTQINTNCYWSKTSKKRIFARERVFFRMPEVITHLTIKRGTEQIVFANSNNEFVVIDGHWSVDVTEYLLDGKISALDVMVQGDGIEYSATVGEVLLGRMPRAWDNVAIPSLIRKAAGVNMQVLKVDALAEELEYQSLVNTGSRLQEYACGWVVLQWMSEYGLEKSWAFEVVGSIAEATSTTNMESDTSEPAYMKGASRSLKLRILNAPQDEQAYLADIVSSRSVTIIGAESVGARVLVTQANFEEGVTRKTIELTVKFGDYGIA